MLTILTKFILMFSFLSMSLHKITHLAQPVLKGNFNDVFLPQFISFYQEVARVCNASNLETLLNHPRFSSFSIINSQDDDTGKLNNSPRHGAYLFDSSIILSIMPNMCREIAIALLMIIVNERACSYFITNVLKI